MSEREEFVQLEQIEDPLVPLSKPQRRRALCLAEARAALIGSQPMIYANGRGSTSASLTAQGVEVAPFDLVYVAAYIENGYVADGLEDPSLADMLKAADEVPPEPKEMVTPADVRPIDPNDPCPFDKHHLLRAHFPGGAWFGYDPQTHERLSHV